MNKIIAVFASFFLIQTASAQTTNPGPTETSGTHNYSHDKVAYFGGLAGYGTGSNSFDGFTWGATVGSKLTDQFGWDVYFSSTQETVGGVTAKVMPIVADLNYHATGPINFYVGPRAGVSILDVSGGLVDDTQTDFALGAQIGTDFFFTDAFSVGVNVNWTHAFRDVSDKDLWNFVAPVKVWF